MAKAKNKDLLMNWYIITCGNGNEETVIKNLKAKVKAMHFDDMITDAKIIKVRETLETFFDDRNPQQLPPKSMRNTTTTKWKTIGEGKYQKVKIIDRNKFPGYIYVKMVMNDDTWYAVRNAQNISGLVGSSGKGAKPVPITYEEEMLLSGESEDPNIRVVVTPNAIIEMDRDRFDEAGNLIGFENNKVIVRNHGNDIVDFDASTSTAKAKNLDTDSRLLDESTNESVSVSSEGMPKFRVGHSVRVLEGEYIDSEGSVINVDASSDVGTITGIIISLDDATETAEVEIDFLGKTIVIPVDYKKLKLNI